MISPKKGSIKLKLKSKKPKIVTPEIKSKRLGEKEFYKTVTVGIKDKYYRVKSAIKEYDVLLSEEARKILKENPGISKFIEDNILYKKSVELVKPKIYETKNCKIILSLPKRPNLGNTNKGVFRLYYYNKRTNRKKTYFLKIGKLLKFTDSKSTSEFLAIKKLESLGIKIIKPQFAFFGNRRERKLNIIVYDYTNLMNYEEVIHLLTIKEKELIERKKKEICNWVALNSHQNPQYNFFISDMTNNSNIYLKKIKNGYDLYFTDLFKINNSVFYK